MIGEQYNSDGTNCSSTHTGASVDITWTCDFEQMTVPLKGSRLPFIWNQWFFCFIHEYLFLVSSVDPSAIREWHCECSTTVAVFCGRERLYQLTYVRFCVDSRVCRPSTLQAGDQIRISFIVVSCIKLSFLPSGKRHILYTNIT